MTKGNRWAGYAPAYHAIATITFIDQAAMTAAMAVSGPVLADFANFTNVAPQMRIGETCA